MMNIRLQSHPDGVVPLGDKCEFALAPPPDIETRLFLRHNGIRYLNSIGDWAPRQTVRLALEATGKYTLLVQWRGPNGQGWATADFRVGSAEARDNGIRMIQLDAETRLWVPTAGESDFLSGHEASTFDLLRKIVKPGAVVYDIGAHLGLYSIQLARLTGDQGWVYCIEANPLCISFLRSNLELNGVTNFEILPTALAGGSGSCEFTINYFNTLLGIGSASPFTRDVGHKISVATASLDELIETFDLRPPDVIKMDIEGGEVVAVPGMRRTIERWRPTLLIELHGRAGARPTLAALDGVSYRFEDPASAQTFDGPRQLAEWFPESCRQVIGYPDR